MTRHRDFEDLLRGYPALPPALKAELRMLARQRALRLRREMFRSCGRALYGACRAAFAGLASRCG